MNLNRHCLEKSIFSMLTNVWRHAAGVSKTGLGLALVACLVVFIVSTYRWPLIGDATLLHYVIFLMKHGMAPYRDIIDMNMPGTYLIQEAVVNIAGDGSLAWRLFDFFLLASAMTAMIVIALPYGWFAGFFAGALFALIHGVDGVPHSGQRDFVMSVLLLNAYAALFCATRRNWAWCAGLFGVLIGTAAMVKPTVAPLGLLLMALLVYKRIREDKPAISLFLSGIAGMAVIVLLSVLFIQRYHAWVAFMEVLSQLLPYDATLGRKPISYLLQHSLSPILPIAILWFLAVVVAWRRLGWEKVALLIGAGVSLASYIIQGKGYVYHRYPLIAIILILSSIQFSEAFKEGVFVRGVAVAGLVYGSFVLAPISAFKIVHYEWWKDDFQANLRHDLDALGGPALSGNVQCIDMSAGCIKTLDRMRLVQATGFLYEYYLLSPNQNPYVLKERSSFMRLLLQNPPKVLVVTDQDYLFGDHGFEKIRRWPAFDRFLMDHYSLYKLQPPLPFVKWEPRESPQYGYEIFVLK